MRGTVIEIAVRNAGVRKGMRGATFLLEWSIAAADGVHFEGSVTDQLRAYMTWWDISERSAWRHLSEFRQAFPGEETPARLAAELAPNFADLVQRLAEISAQRRAKAVGSSLAVGFGAVIAA